MKCSPLFQKVTAMELKDVIRDYRKRNGLTLADFGRRVGVSRAYICMLEKGKDSKTGKLLRPSVKTMKRIADAMDITIDELFRILEMDELLMDPKQLVTLPEGLDVYPLLPEGVSAGVLQEIDTTDKLKQVYVSDMFLGKYAHEKRIVFMYVNGDSMNRVIPDGALIAVLTDVSLGQIVNGDIVVCSDDKGDYAIKRFYLDGEHNRIILQPDSYDPIYYPLFFAANDPRLEIVGKVIMYQTIL